MSISNHSVNVKASTEDLESLLNEYEASHAAMMEQGDEADEAMLEWLESGIELIEDELERRVSPDFGAGAGFGGQDITYDTDSLQDRGIELGSYAS